MTDNWPSSRYLLDDPTYDAHYISALEGASTEIFATTLLTKQYKIRARLLAPYATAVHAWLDRTTQRAAEFKRFLEKQP